MGNANCASCNCNWQEEGKNELLTKEQRESLKRYKGESQEFV
jgi:hypothetical protein